MSKAEIMVIVILFHSSGFRCLKYFYKGIIAVTIHNHTSPSNKTAKSNFM